MRHNERSVRALAAIVLGVALTAAAAACAAIIGIDDRTAQGGGTGDGASGLDATMADGSVRQPDGARSDAGASSDAPSVVPDASVDAPPPCATDPCVLATMLNHPFAMTSDANNVYWVEFGTDQGTKDGAVKGCPLAGCGAGPTVYAPGQLNPRGLVVDATHIYWGTATYGGVTGTILRCPLAGCNGSPQLLAPAGIPFGLSVDATYVYWVDTDDNTVRRALKTGSAAEVLYDGGGTSNLALPEGCAVDNAFVYVTDRGQDLFRVPLAGGDPIPMASGPVGGPCPLLLGTDSVYYGAGSQIMRATKTARDGGVAIASGITVPNGLAQDPATGLVYWSDFGGGSANDGTVGKVGPDGGGQVNIRATLQTPNGVAVSGPYVFWLSNGTLASPPGTGATANSGSLLRTAK